MSAPEFRTPSFVAIDVQVLLLWFTFSQWKSKTPHRNIEQPECHFARIDGMRCAIVDHLQTQKRNETKRHETHQSCEIWTQVKTIFFFRTIRTPHIGWPISGPFSAASRNPYLIDRSMLYSLKISSKDKFECVLLLSRTHWWIVVECYHQQSFRKKKEKNIFKTIRNNAKTFNVQHWQTHSIQVRSIRSLSVPYSPLLWRTIRRRWFSVYIFSHIWIFWYFCFFTWPAPPVCFLCWYLNCEN